MEKIVARVAADLGDGATGERLFAQKTALASLLRQRRYVLLRRRFVVAVAVSLALTAGVILMYSVLQPEVLTFTVNESGAYGMGEVGKWMLADERDGTRVAFAQGSSVHIRSGARVRVVEADDDAVQMELARGVITADIVGNAHTRWVVNAGKWRITVLGTRFSVDWKEKANILEVTVFRGKVKVQGPGETGDGVVVSRGHRYHAAGQKRSLSPQIRQTDPADNSDSERGRDGIADADDTVGMSENNNVHSNESNDDGGSASAEPPPAESGSRPRGSGDARGKDEPKLEWLVHYANGEYEKAIQVAGRYGIDSLIIDLNAVRLWKLQDAARISKKYDLSFKILHAFRNRFPTHANARIAAFLLGRIAMDKKRFSSASQWFNTYIAEDPEGPLSEESHGLLIVAYEKMGNQRLAQNAAREYLNRYSGGAFARIATKQLNQ